MTDHADFTRTAAAMVAENDRVPTQRVDAVIIRWAGVNRDGEARTGFASTDDVTEWLRKHFRAGWRRLVVKDDCGRTVGKIEQSVDDERVWWAERSVGGE